MSSSTKRSKRETEERNFQKERSRCNESGQVHQCSASVNSAPEMLSPQGPGLGMTGERHAHTRARKKGDSLTHTHMHTLLHPLRPRRFQRGRSHTRTRKLNEDVVTPPLLGWILVWSLNYDADKFNLLLRPGIALYTAGYFVISLFLILNLVKKKLISLPQL